MVLISPGLLEILRCVLAIGNAMNQGSWKGQAAGFRMSSLAKLHQTKSSDGTSTVLDYLVLMLYTRAEEGGDLAASAAFNIDVELRMLSKCKSISLTDLSTEITTLKRGLESSTRVISGGAEPNLSPSIQSLISQASDTIQQLTVAFDNLKSKGLHHSIVQ
jgi:hypothetical protein